jgi:hypothetical protein
MVPIIAIGQASGCAPAMAATKDAKALQKLLIGQRAELGL